MILIWLLICGAAMARAQTGLAINSIFGGRYATDPKVTESIMSGNQKFLKQNHLTVLATFKAPASEYAEFVERAVSADAAKAIGKNVRYKEGKLYFGLFILPPVSQGDKKLNRYLYYLHNTSAKKPNVLVVYLEGTLNEQQVSDLIQSLTRKNK